jgi:alpha-glucosidase (family GH31 glycosyl hydrolase)
MDTKQLIESLIKDLYENKPLSEVFLKLQVIVYMLKNEQLTEWFNSENNGYDKSIVLPEYRILPVLYYAQVEQDRGFSGSLMYNHYNLPIDLIEDKKIQNIISKLEYRDSISNITDLVSSADEGTISIAVPNTTLTMSLFSKRLQSNCYIHAIWREIPKNAVQNIIMQIKSKLLQFLLEINENLNLNISFTEMENKEKIEKAFSQNITNNIYGNNNNVATGQNVEQNISQSFVDYGKLKEYGVEEHQIAELKAIEKELNKNTLREKTLSWFSKVSAAIAARGLYDNIPAIMECVKSLIN